MRRARTAATACIGFVLWAGAGGVLAGEGDLRAAVAGKGIDVSSWQVLPRAGEADAYGFVVPGAQALDVWQKLRELVPETKHHPVILPAEGAMRFGKEVQQGFAKYSMKSILEAARKIDAAAWLKKRQARDSEEEEEGVEEGEWQEDQVRRRKFTADALHIAAVIGGEGSAKVEKLMVALLPVEKPWEVPAYLVSGGWNECPESEVHVALMKYWHERYGAEIVSDGGDFFELKAARPPKEKAAALALAREQYAYCPDIVDQGTGTLAGLAQELVDGEVWFFWWD